MSDDSSKSSSNSSSDSSSSYLSDAIALETVKLTTTALQGGTWTWAIAGSLLFIISIDGAKKMFVKLADKSIDYICSMAASDWQAFGSTLLAPVRLVGKGVMLPYRFISKKFHKPQVKSLVKAPMFEQTFTLDLDTKIWKAVWNYPNICYDQTILKVCRLNGSLVQHEQWSDVTFVTEQFVLQVISPLIMMFTTDQPKKLVDVKVGGDDVVAHVETQELLKEVQSMNDSYFASSFSFKNDENELFIVKSYKRWLLLDPSRTSPYSLSSCVCSNTGGIVVTSCYNMGGHTHYNTPSLFQSVIVWLYLSVVNGLSALGTICYGHTNQVVTDINLTGAHKDFKLYTLLNQLSFFHSIKHILVEVINNIPKAGYKSSDPSILLNFVGKVPYLDTYLVFTLLVLNCCGTNYDLYVKFCKLSFISFLHLSTTFPQQEVTPKQQFIKIAAHLKPLLKSIFVGFDSELIVKLNIWFKSSLNIPITVSNPNSSNSTGSVSCQLTSTGDKQLSKSEQIQLALQFFKDQQYQASLVLDENDCMIKTHYTKIKVSYVKEKVVNPAYQEFQKQAKTLGLSKEDSDSKEEVEAKHVDFTGRREFNKISMLAMTPPEFIYEDKRECTLEVQELNKSFKAFNTLYLQKQDQSRLLTCLNNFKHHKKLLQDLGFPHKLGVLLHGEPGTGKSATILAIASYLQKDLYYVDLKTIKCNSDLKKVVDHILTINLQGGIIVFEDIDANTSIVHSRDKTVEASTTSVCGDAESELTLDFFLNILQGTLTRDDMVFIITTNYVERLDAALIRDGRIDVNIEMKLCNEYQLELMWKTIFKREVSRAVLSKFKPLTYTPASILSRCAQFLTVNAVDEPDKFEAMDYEILQPFCSE